MGIAVAQPAQNSFMSAFAKTLERKEPPHVADPTQHPDF